MLKSKLHGARVTDRRLDYEGSISIDASLMKAAGIRVWEQVHIYDLASGARFETYAIEGPAKSGEVCVNGAAAHLVEVGNRIIVAAYALVPDDGLDAFRPRIVVIDEKNRIKKRL